MFPACQICFFSMSFSNFSSSFRSFSYLYPAQAPKSHLGSAIKNGVSKTLLMSLSQLKILFGKFCYSSVVNAWLKFVKI